MYRLAVAAHLGISVVALALLLWGLEGQRRAGALPQVAVPPESAFPVRFSGQNLPAQTISSRSELAFVVSQYPPGTRVRLGGEAPSGDVVLEAALPAVVFAITVVTSLLLWGVATCIFALRLDQAGARPFFWGTLLYGLAIGAGEPIHPGISAGLEALRPITRLAALAYLPVCLVSYALVFPTTRPWLRRQPAWILAAMLAAGLVAAAEASAILHYASAPSTETWAALDRAVHRWGRLYLAMGVGAGLVLLWQRSGDARTEREQRQGKWVWWGIAAGASPYVFLHALPKSLGLPWSLPLPAARLCTLAVPAAFTLAVVRHQYLDIDVVIRRSVLYALLAGVLVGFYFFIASGVGTWISGRVPAAATLAPVVAALAAGALFSPTRTRIGRWVDRTLFQIRGDTEARLRGFQASLATVSSQGQVTRLLHELLVGALQPHAAAVALREGSDLHVAGGLRDPASDRDIVEVLRRTQAANEMLCAEHATSQPRLERADFPEQWRIAGAVIAQPVRGGVEVDGVILLGPKRSDRRYLEHELAFVSRAAEAAGAAAERLHLIQQVLRERIERTRREELDRAKADFLSRVAHDLRTPLTSIDWAARNLADGLAGPLMPAQNDYVRSVGASARQLGRLVDNLLRVSGLESSADAPTLDRVELSEVVAEALAVLRPLAAARSVSLATDAGRTASVWGERERLLQALVNVLQNAIRYSPDGGRIDIELAMDGEAVSLSVRDRGPGVPESARERIFERFQQGPQSPHGPSRGLGLGLYIARTHLTSMGGKIWVEEDAGGGARFVCRLRRADASETSIGFVADAARSTGG